MHSPRFPHAAGRTGSSVTGSADTSLPYRRDIDGLRAIAVLSVVIFHAAPGRFPGGFIGVDIFFVISGFLISSILLRELAQKRFAFSQFYVRRILRIFPPLLLVMGATLVIGSMLLPAEDYRPLGKHVASGAGFVSNFALWTESGYFDSKADFKPLLHLWSLGVEEQFYIVWPLLLYVCCSRKMSLERLLAALFVLSLFACLLATATNPIAAFYSPFTRFWELLVGCATALAVQRGAPPRYASPASWAGLLAIGLALAVINDQRAFPGLWALLPTLGAALLIWAGPAGWVNRFLLANPLAVGIGLISYSLYLWHWPLLSFLRLTAGTEVHPSMRAGALVTAFILSLLSYRFVERPIRAQHGSLVAAWALVCLMTVLGFSGWALFAFGPPAWRPAKPVIVNAGEIGHESFFDTIRSTAFPCLPVEIRAASDTWKGMSRCFQSKPHGGQVMAIIGDSHGEHLFPGLAKEFGAKNVVFYGMEGLPTLQNKEFAPVFAYLARNHAIADVFIAAAWSRKLRGPDRQWRTELQQTVDYLAAEGRRVYLVEDVHSFSFAPNVCKYAGRAWIDNRCSEEGTSPAYVGYFQEIASRTPGVQVVSPNSALCDGGKCYMALGGSLLYRDEHHLTINGSALAAGAIARQVPEMAH